MKRSRRWLFLGVALLVAAGVAASLGVALARAWPGEQSVRELVAGDTVTMDNGLSVTVPAGWHGFYKRFYRIPVWIPLGESMPGLGSLRSDYLVIGDPDSSASPRGFMCASFYGAREPQTGQILAESPVLRVYMIGDFPQSEPPVKSLGIEANIPRHFPGKASVSASPEEPLDSLRATWRLLKVEGATIP